eukprot:scaffold13293_cov120-Cylindrotheca_fusiformis.AAC.1
MAGSSLLLNATSKKHLRAVNNFSQYPSIVDDFSSEKVASSLLLNYSSSSKLFTTLPISIPLPLHRIYAIDCAG